MIAMIVGGRTAGKNKIVRKSPAAGTRSYRSSERASGSSTHSGTPSRKTTWFPSTSRKVGSAKSVRKLSSPMNGLS